MMTLPDSPPTPETVAADLATAIRQLLRRLRSEANPGALSLPRMGVLSRLEHDGPLTTAELARAELMKPQSMGSIVAGLEQEGLIERRPHAIDRRQIHFVLTDEGVALRRRHRAVKEDWLLTALTRLDPDEMKTLAAAIPLIRRIGES